VYPNRPIGWSSRPTDLGYDKVSIPELLPTTKGGPYTMGKISLAAIGTLLDGGNMTWVFLPLSNKGKHQAPLIMAILAIQLHNGGGILQKWKIPITDFYFGLLRILRDIS
jgi:hypothetical protein